jgi:hypothetical protein
MANFFFKYVNFGQKTHFLIAKSSSNLTMFIHLSKFSSIYDDSIQNLDESAALFYLLAPHARYMKIYRKNTVAWSFKLQPEDVTVELMLTQSY